MTYSTRAVCLATGASYRVVDYWDRTGVLRPSVAAAHGSGACRRYSERDVRVACVLNTLRQMGAGTDVLRRVVTSLAGDDVAGGRLRVSPTGDTWRGSEPGWACWWAVDLDLVVRAVEGVQAEAEAS